ncbi:MAG: hypothetical protein K2O04_03040 [Clostridiales bacterium]|nr:hypothetical protein [Clostridiales bacterium]
MKKKVKALIIAAAVVAIAGIGAISFAKWSGTGYNEVTSQGPLGDVTLVGFNADTAAAWTGKLVPMDQPVNTIKDGGTTVTSIILPSLTAVKDQTITVTAALPEDFTPTTGKSTKLYVVAQASGDAPDASEIAVAANEIDSDGVVVLTVPAAGVTNTAYTLYFALDSDDTAAMNQTYSITVTLSPAA